MTNTSVSLAEFRELAENRRVIPVIRKVENSDFTAVGLYQTLAEERPGTFLLESAEHAMAWSRYSFVGVNTSAMLSEVDGESAWSGRVPEITDCP